MKNKGTVKEFDSDSVVKKPYIDSGIESSVIETNARGGKQSKIKGRMTEVPPLALIEVSAVMGLGAEAYPREADGTPNWYNISCSENLDHAMEHVANYLAEKNKPEATNIDGLSLGVERNPLILREELSHATARMLMGLEQFIREEV